MAGVQHTQRKHALLSASGAARWMNCPPSARLEEKFNEAKTSSSFAQEGTLAHEFADVSLRCFNNEIDFGTRTKEFNKLRAHELYTDEMEDEVQKYVDYVAEVYGVAKQQTDDAILLVEQRLDFSHIVENGFGTGDAIVIYDGIMYIIDLKYGKGIRVDADENPQLMLYGLGALREFEMSYDITEVRLCIMQPRLDHISEWTISADGLNKWGEEVVKPKALQAYDGEGDCKAGSWCKWCKVKAMCKALADANTALAQHEFKEPQLLNDEQLLAVFKQTPMLQDWANAVSDYILQTALDGKKWEGYKVVEGRSNRKIADEEAMKARLKEIGIKPDQFLVVKLATLTALEKLVGKKEFSEKLGELIIRPQGRPTLVPESDKRQPFNSIEEDFKN